MENITETPYIIQKKKEQFIFKTASFAFFIKAASGYLIDY